MPCNGPVHESDATIRGLNILAESKHVTVLGRVVHMDGLLLDLQPRSHCLCVHLLFAWH